MKTMTVIFPPGREYRKSCPQDPTDKRMAHHFLFGIISGTDPGICYIHPIWSNYPIYLKGMTLDPKSSKEEAEGP